MKAIFAIVLLAPSIAWGASCGPGTYGWAEGSCPPEYKQLRVGEIRCEERDGGLVVCQHDGPACQAIFRKRESHNARIFNCVDPKSPNHPCPPFDDDIEKRKLDRFESMRCDPVAIFPYDGIQR